MSVRDQLNFTEKRRIIIQQEGLGAPWFTNALASADALCTYSTGGQVTVTISPFYIADTLGTPITLQIIGLPEMYFDNTNIYPGTPTEQWLACHLMGFLNGVFTDLSHAAFQLKNDSRHILTVQIYKDGFGANFDANSSLYITEQTFTYKWAKLPEHGGI